MRRALDLFCKAGGASMGLHRAGFDVVGVDIEPQPNYPFTFVQADALRPPFDLGGFDFVWASPPCQDDSIGAARWKSAGRVYPNLIEPTRELLRGHPFTAIENVPRAKLRRDLALTGAMFGLKTYRRRHFELSFFCMAPQPGRPFGPLTKAGSYTAAGNGGHGPNRPRLWAADMGVDRDTLMAHYQSNHVAVAYGDVFGEMVALSLELGFRVRVLGAT